MGDPMEVSRQIDMKNENIMTGSRVIRNTKEKKRLTAAILEWYRKNRRDLPWRQTRNPYHIWVSEIMLQQTQVETVIPYYQRFVARFPTIRALASASLHDVLKAWENLGYYARARNLHIASKRIVTQFQGKLPHTWDELTALPGVGNYTASAILSMAYGKPYAAVDSNVRRILCRICLIDKPVFNAQTLWNIQALASGLVPEDSPGVFNQALMDLGAMICRPRYPICELCPLREYCLAHQRGMQEKLPVRKRGGILPHKNMMAAVLKNEQGWLLIVRRLPRGLLGGLWKFPGGLKVPGETKENALLRTVREELGIQIVVREPIVSVKHAYTHFRVTIHAFSCGWIEGEPHTRTCVDWRWVEPVKLDDYPVSKADRKIMGSL